MKKIISLVIIIILAIISYVIMHIGIDKIGIWSVSEIKSNEEKLENTVQSINVQTKGDFVTKQATLKEQMKKLNDSKSQYLNLASISSDNEVIKASQNQKYSLEYLWTIIGNYASEYSINLKLEVASGSSADKKNLNFTAEGYYKSISNFIYDLENSDKFNFNIKNFKLSKNEDGDSKSETSGYLVATFNVEDVYIDTSTMTENKQQDIEESNNKNNTTTNTNSNTTTNTNTTNTTNSTTTY